ncbi:MAG: hypothetical protein ACLFPF_05740 [Halanaerobiales bacterium]
MGDRFHGVFPLFLIGLAIGMGIYFVIIDSRLVGLLYCALISISLNIVIYSYCCKCKGRNSCAHVIPAKIAEIFPERKQGKYTSLDYLGLVLSIVILIGFPQYWLFHNIVFLLFFWVLIIIAVVEILYKVCPKCENRECGICKSR